MPTALGGALLPGCFPLPSAPPSARCHCSRSPPCRSMPFQAQGREHPSLQSQGLVVLPPHGWFVAQGLSTSAPFHVSAPISSFPLCLKLLCTGVRQQCWLPARLTLCEALGPLPQGATGHTGPGCLSWGGCSHLCCWRGLLWFGAVAQTRPQHQHGAEPVLGSSQLSTMHRAEGTPLLAGTGRKERCQESPIPYGGRGAVPAPAPSVGVAPP